MEKENIKGIGRREFLRRMGLGTVAVAGATMVGCGDKSNPAISDEHLAQTEIPKGKMEYRKGKKGEKVSILGYGMMRLPTTGGNSGREEKEEEIDQEMVNALVDKAIEYGVTYFDTSPAYCQGRSETATGIALSRHPRDSYYIATKLSNFAPSTWDREESIKMYKNSFKALQVDYIDYMLLHAIGDGDDAHAQFRSRYIDNGILDFLLEERKAGHIRNLGFSYHGDASVMYDLLAQNDKYDWDFVQIQMNYLDWQHAQGDDNAEKMYNRLTELNIPVVIMEPLLGGRLANLPDHITNNLKQREPERSVASWAFRYCGSFPNVLTVLSGMTYMEHLEDNLRSYCDFKPLTEDEIDYLYKQAGLIAEYPTIPCTGCNYCMPCPYGIDIPANFKHYNKCVNQANIPENAQDPNYRKARQAFLVGYDRSVPKLRQANHCIGCGQCNDHCPQRINIPEQLARIDSFVDKLKQQG